jgi:hypothetical protein
MIERNFFGELIEAIKTRRRDDFWFEAWHYRLELNKGELPCLLKN